MEPSESAERRRAAAHRPGTAAAGPYGHPLHPSVVPVAIGAWVCALVFDVASLAVEGGAYARPAKWLLAIGLAAGVVAAGFGLLDYRRLVKGTKAHQVATQHLILNVVVLVLLAVSFALRQAAGDDLVDGTPIEAFVPAVIALLLLAASGWLGGELTYRYGVRVADEADQLKGYRPDPTGDSADQEADAEPTAD